MKLFLDDVRNPDNVYPEEAGWTVVRTANEAINALKEFDFSVVSLDHDLGTIETGYSVLAWLEKEVAENMMTAPKDIRIHSANPVGRKRMEAALASIRRLESISRG